MSKEEWLATLDPLAVLDQLRAKRLGNGKGISSRKWRLASVAYCRAVWHLLTDQRSRAAVEAAELYADRLLPPDANPMLLEQAAEEAVATDLADVESHASAPAAAAAVSLALWAHADYGTLMAQRWTLGPIGSEGQIRILDCVFGIPFLQIIPDPAWRTSTVVALAQQMYDSRDFSAMPILGDALQDAACDHADILDHCRSAGPHVRGCWVVDLVLGRE